MGQMYRLTLVAGVVAAIAASVACGAGDGGGSGTPTTGVSTPSAAATSTVAGLATSPALTPTTAAVAPSATAAAQATSAPAVQPTVAPPPPTVPPPPPSAEQSLTIVAKDVKFSPSSLTARAGAVLHLTLDNQDAGVPHDIVLYDASGAIVGATEPVNGPVQQTVTVMLDSPRYTFKCSVHPQTMNGSLLAQ